MGLVSLLETIGLFCGRVRGLGCLPAGPHPSLADGCSWVHPLGPSWQPVYGQKRLKQPERRRKPRRCPPLPVCQEEMSEPSGICFGSLVCVVGTMPVSQGSCEDYIIHANTITCLTRARAPVGSG